MTSSWLKMLCASTTHTISAGTFTLYYFEELNGLPTLALAADIRLASTAASFNAAFVRIGLSAGDLGASWLLTRLIGPGAASEICFTGRIVAAAEKAFNPWAGTAPRERGALLLKIAEHLESHAQGYAALESRNTGKPLAAARNDKMPSIADVFRFFAARLPGRVRSFADLHRIGFARGCFGAGNTFS